MLIWTFLTGIKLGQNCPTALTFKLQFGQAFQVSSPSTRQSGIMRAFSIAATLLCFVALSQAFFYSPKAVEGIISCGSEAEVVDIEITSCQRVPCEAHVGEKYRIDVKFKPKLSHDMLHLNIVLIHGGQNHVIVDGDVENSAVEAGRQYMFGYEYSITGAFLGPAQIAFNLLGKNGAADYPELCFYVGINVQTP